VYLRVDLLRDFLSLVVATWSNISINIVLTISVPLFNKHAFFFQGVRKIVISTNIAETSITIEDCVFVVEVGRMKEKWFDPNKNMESLGTGPCDCHL
jgi:hypothetical protein